MEHPRNQGEFKEEEEEQSDTSKDIKAHNENHRWLP